MDFFAHSTQDASKADWQPLQQHLQTVGAQAAERARCFGAESMANVAGTLHDLGKYTRRFQQRLEGTVPRVDHSTWGAEIARQHFGALGTLLAYAIAGHHAGLANGQLGQQRRALRERLDSDYLGTLPPLLDAWRQEIKLPDALSLPPAFEAKPERGAFQLALITRMLFSCLVDADFIDTDNFYRQLEGKPPREEHPGPSLTHLRERLDQHLAGLPAADGINPLRHRILEHVRQQAAQDPGVFSLTVPTGGGKTLASMAFALDHAIRHGLRRVIYVAPFTSIIEQNASVFREAFGELGDDAVLEHHSALFDDPKIDRQSWQKRHQAMENWDAPIIVTTAVQFFESLFADRPARCRKLHNIAASVVVLDEAQTIPLHLLRPCVTLLDELALNYRTSIMLCTATQPALGKAQGFKYGFDKVRELAPEPPRLYDKLRRVKVRHVGQLDDDELASELRAREQVLCIVNNRRHARHLAESIDQSPGTLHLSTLMHARHRSRVLAEVRQRLADGKPCRLVSTSLIEAGVDVDFPTVLRAEAGLDSIAQAAGRCNREGRKPPSASEVLVFTTANPDWVPPPALEQFACAFREVRRNHAADLLAPDAIEAYFKELYWLVDQLGLDKHDLMGEFDGVKQDGLPFETLAANFQMIETRMRPIIVSFDPKSGGESKDVERLLKDLAFAPATARKLQPWLVQVPQYAYDALWRGNVITPIAQDKYGDQFVRLTNLHLYSHRFGLSWDQAQFRGGSGSVV